MAGTYAPLGLDMFGDPIKPPNQRVLAKKWTFPPFSVLDARNGDWQERKRSWLALGIKSELGRGDNLLARSDETRDINHYSKGKDAEARNLTQVDGTVYHDSRVADADAYRKKEGTRGAGKAQIYAGSERINDPDGYRRQEGTKPARTTKAKAYGNGNARLAEIMHEGREIHHPDGTPAAEAPWESGTSIFDPVLTELSYKWWCPPAGHILDPFSGGSVRGIVAAMLGFAYTGVDLSGPQIAANTLQAQELLIAAPGRAQWHCGDSKDVRALAPDLYDFVFTCPPYGNLEVYSDDPRDISTYELEAFHEAYTHIIAESCAMLKPDRYAAIVVGDYRDKAGNYTNFPARTIDAFLKAGLSLYNEAILVTVAGSLPVRAHQQFNASRKLGKSHQNVLVFVKGDGRKAADACKPQEGTE